MSLTNLGNGLSRLQPNRQNQDSPSQSYTVRPGDTLSGIARRAGVSLDELKRLNPELQRGNNNFNLIRPGDQVRLPEGTQAPEGPANAQAPSETPAAEPRTRASQSTVNSSRRRAASAQPQARIPDVPARNPVTSTTPASTESTTNAAPNGTVDTHNPTLQRLASSRLNPGPAHSCVRTTLNNMERLGVPNFPGGTSDDPNNPRGAMVRLLRTGNWVSAPIPGAQRQQIHSPYGNVQAQVLSRDAYDRAVRNGQIPNGAVIFQTRHGWDYSGGSRGNDMGIVQNGSIHNYADMHGMHVYRDVKQVVVLVPRDAVRQ